MDPKTSRMLTIALIVGSIAVIIIVVWRTFPRTNSPQGRLALLRAKNVALGHMENTDHAASLADLKRIVLEQPNDPLGLRNLTIALFAPTDQGPSGTTPEHLAELLRAVERMLEVEPEAPHAHQMAALVYRERADKSRAAPAEMSKNLQLARDHFKKAGELAPNDPAPSYGLYRLDVDFVNADQLTKEGMEALVTAARRAPNNLAAQVELMYWQAIAEQPAVRGTLEKVLNLLPPGTAPVRTELESALEALKKDMGRVPPEAIQAISVARNLLQPDQTYRDGMRLLLPHPLEFVLQDFRPTFYDGLPPDAETNIKVAFVREPMPESDKATPLTMAVHEDLTGNGAYATVLLRPAENATRITTIDADGKQAFDEVEVPGVYDGLALADLDLDITPIKDANLPADLDLILHGPAGVRILEQRAADGKRRWVDRTADAKLPPLKDVRWLTVCDFDHDGNLDLIVGTATGTHLLRNTGAWVFEDVTERSTGIKPLLTVSGIWGDFDREGDLDLYVITAGGELVLLENLRGGRFVANKVTTGVEKPSAILTFDANNDGWLDLLLGHDKGATLLFAGDKKPPHESKQRLELPAAHRVLQAGTIDYDNDGWLDVWLLTDDPLRPLRLFHNRGGKAFEDVSNLVPELPGPLRSVLVTDIDHDGDLDLVLASPSGLTLLRNHGGNQNRWIDIRLRALLNKDINAKGLAAKVNYYNIGGTLEVKAGRHYQLQQVHGTSTHFGLGAHQKAEVARVVWTNGVPQVVIRPRVDTTIIEDQRPKASCPFLYTWDGQRFVMITDCLWSSALGMKLAHDVEMDHQRQLNHLIIPETKLKPRDGRFVLQFTNEMWEVPYLDQVELWVIDHPADTEVYTNQRIPPGPPEDFRFITAKDRRTPRIARDQTGRDVLSIIQKRDDIFLGTFRRRRYVGLAEPHYLELDLGDLGTAKKATLFLTGWIWPTDTSANVAISQDPRFRGVGGTVGGVEPPSLLVPDGKGGWTTALPMMGFPCGKLQTVAVELPLERFPAGDYRVRINTSMELYWDEVFFTVDEEAAPLDVRRLPTARGDLHYRGYSRVYQESPSGPQLFDYYDVDPAPIWRPLPGPYTRYGAITELLHQPDNQYVVPSPGDELTLEFDALTPPPPGRRRTFLFYASGWLKDFDMNGTSSEAAAPLPFAGMKKYPYAAPEEFPRTPELQRFLREYMTRDDDGSRFWNALR